MYVSISFGTGVQLASTLVEQNTPSHTSVAVEGGGQDGSQFLSTSAVGDTPLSQEDHSVIREATHESLIPLEEDPHDLEELVEDDEDIGNIDSMEPHQLLTAFAREMGRADQNLVNEIMEEAMESVGSGHDSSGGGELNMSMEDSTSDLASVSDDDEEDEEEEEDELYEDNCNSAGEEVHLL